MHKYDIEDKKNAIKNEILDLYISLGHIPTQKEYSVSDKSKYSKHQITYLFGSWTNALSYCDLQSEKYIPIHEINDKDLADEFIKISNQLQKIPTQNEFTIKSKYSIGPYIKRFKTWKNTTKNYLKTEADKFNFDTQQIIIKLNNPEEKKTIAKKVKLSDHQKKSTILEELAKIAKKLNAIPSQSDYKKNNKSEYSIYQIIYLFGSYSEAIKQAGIDKKYYKKITTINEDDLINEFIEISNKISSFPSMKLFNTYSQYSYRPYIKRFGTV